ncbi:MAG: helicase HerA domain-containing protein [Conexivisphaera sp.]
MSARDAGPGDEVGVVTNGALPYEFRVLTRDPVPVGEYLVASAADGSEVLGMVEETEINSAIMEMVRNFSDAREAGRLALSNPRDRSYSSSVRVLGVLADLRRGEARMPSLPPVPGSPVRRASREDLSAAFGGSGRSWIPVGSLLRAPSVRVHVDLNRVASRHLAILASTGAGKSNMLALIAKAVAGLRGTMVIFDYHGEYAGLNLGRRGRAILPRINPRHLDSDELADLLEIREGADRQRHALSEALEGARDERDFWGELQRGLDGIAEREREYREAARRARDIVRAAVRRLGSILDPDGPDPLDQLAEGYVNVVNLSELSPRQADVVISRYMDEVLADRKRFASGERGRLSMPVVLALEEAHVFVPGDARTKTRESASRIAREGRKFGVSLIIVSQRPQRLDQDVLSQMGSLAVGRLLNQRDRAFVQDSSEFITEEMSGYLPDLNPGEALLVGQWVKIPALVRVDRVEEKLVGRDVDAVGEWSSREGPSEDTGEFIERPRGGTSPPRAPWPRRAGPGPPVSPR